MGGLLTNNQNATLGTTKRQAVPRLELEQIASSQLIQGEDTLDVTLTGEVAVYTWVGAPGATITPGDITLTGAVSVFTWVAKDGVRTAAVTLTGQVAIYSWVAKDGVISLGGAPVTLTGTKAVYTWVAKDGAISIAAPAVGDVYAWFPGDPGPRPPTDPSRRRKHRHPLRVPRALRFPPLEPVPYPLPLTPPPLVELPPAPALPWTNPFDLPAPPAQPQPLPAAPAAAPPPPEDRGAHWTEYEHQPYSVAEDEAEVMQAVLAAVLRRGR